MELVIFCNSSHLNMARAARAGLLLGNPMLVFVFCFLSKNTIIINSARMYANILNALRSPCNEDPG